MSQDNLFHESPGHCFCLLVPQGLGLCILGEMIDEDEDIFVPFSGGWKESHYVAGLPDFIEMLYGHSLPLPHFS